MLHAHIDPPTVELLIPTKPPLHEPPALGWGLLLGLILAGVLMVLVTW